MKPSALGDLRVLDLAGPLGWYGTKLFADLGADVLRIEQPGGDPSRRRPPFPAEDPSTGVPFRYFNTSKRSETIGLETDAGRDRVRELAADADVIFESLGPGTLDRLGLGYEQLSTINPGLVWVAVTPFGPTGPYATWKANDLILGAIGGVMFMAGMPDSPPSQLGGNQIEYIAGAMAGAGALLALAEREKSGIGQLVDISGQIAAAIDGENAVPFWDVDGWERPRLGRMNFYQRTFLFQTRDGWIFINPGNRWDAFTSWLDRFGLLTDELKDPKWEEAAYRAEHHETLEGAIAALAALRTREEMYSEGQALRIAVGPVVAVDELTKDPQLIARDYFRDVEDPVLGTVSAYPGAPFKMSRTPLRITRPAPPPGEHNGEGWKARQASPAPRPPLQGGGLPMSGVRVVDLTWVAAGPFATRLLANFGAEVLKIESAVHPDSTRTLTIPRPNGNDSLNVSGMWNNVNPSKASVALDLRQPGALVLLERLIATADVLVDNYGVDPFPKWGFTLERLRKIRPDLIIARSSVMGRSGPRQGFIGFGNTIAAAAGHNAITGFPGDPPAGACIAHPDYTSNPWHLALAILAALHYRSRTGLGQEIDLSQHESTTSFIGAEILEYTVNGTAPGPIANRRLDAAPHGAYQASGNDRWIAIACETDEEFAALAAMMGRPELAGDPRFRDLAARKQNEDALDSIVGGWTESQDAGALMRALQAAGVPAGAVQSHRQLLDEDPQMLHRGHYLRILHSEAGDRIVDGPGIELSRTPGAIHRPAPLLGEDTERVMRELLGLTEDQLATGFVEGWFV